MTYWTPTFPTRWAAGRGLATLCLLASGAGSGLSSEEAPEWLQPLLLAASQPVNERLETRQAELERQQAAWTVAAEGAPWRPRLFSDVSTSFSEDRPNNSTELGGNTQAIRATENRAELGISQSLSTGTELSLSASTARETNNRANAILSESWVSRVRLTVSQELLRGNQRQANLAAYHNAQSTLKERADEVVIALSDAFQALAEDWLEFGRSNYAWQHATSQLKDARSALELARARQDVGLSGRSEILARERDVAEQQATVGRLERAWQLNQQQLIRQWGSHELPPPPTGVDAALSPRDWDIPDFAQTRAGRLAQYAVERQQRSTLAAANNGLDSLTLRAGAGLFAREETFANAWDRLGERETYDLSAGLRYEHVVGGSRQWAERERAQLALRHARLQWQLSERAWNLSLGEHQAAWQDARADLDERQTTARATTEERDLIAAEFAEGKAGIRDLIDAEQRLRGAEQAVINALFQALISEIRLRRHIDRLPLPALSQALAPVEDSP